VHLKDVISQARKSITANKLRARITIAIIALGITALVGIITAIRGLEGSITANFSRMGSNTFNITSKGFTSKKKKVIGEKRQLKVNNSNSKISYNQALEFKQQFDAPALVSVNNIVSRMAVIKSKIAKTNPNSWVIAADENYLKVSGTEIAYGRNFNPNDISLARDYCIIGNGLAQTLFGKYVQKAVGNSISIDNKKYFVLGVIVNKGASVIDRTDNTALIGINSARRHFNDADKSYIVSVKVNNVKMLDVIDGEATGLMRQIRKLYAYEATNFEINKNDSIATSLLENLNFVKLAAIIIGIITLLGAAIGLMNIMLVAVVERTKEIGLSKAIGAQSKTIRQLFLSESIIISLYGGVWGIVIGIAMGNMVAMAVNSPFTIPWDWIGFACVVCVFVGVTSGFYPAVKASKLNPINALRYE
jgi:putative ABC transport system permease protein